MKFKKHLFLVLYGTIISSTFFIGQEKNSIDPKPIVFNTTYIGDVFSNFNGGIKPGSAYMGYIDITASLNTKKIGLWKNGEICINVQNTHGATVSAEYVGDAQVISNIDNGDYTYLYQLWYKQDFNKLSILAGIHDLNSEFLTSDYSSEYVNSSFGIMPVASLNVPAAIFPKTTLALMLKYSFSQSILFQTAIYDGAPLNLDSVPYNTKILLGNDHGILSISELHFKINGPNGRKGTYKLGSYYHTSNFDDIVDVGTIHFGNYGFYLMIDQMIFPKSEEGDKGLGIFLQLGISPDDRSMNDLFIGFGLNYHGISELRNEDIIGLGFAHASLSNKLANSDIHSYEKSETTIEFFYKLKLGERITFQPEIQYVINPSFDKTLDNAFVGLIRTCLEF